MFTKTAVQKRTGRKLCFIKNLRTRPSLALVAFSSKSLRPEERIRETSWQLQAPGSYDPLTIPYHPTTETLLHRLLSQEGELKPGNGWMPESRARCAAPDIFRAAREAALEFKPGEHLLDEMDREMAYLSGQALEMLEETREPSQPDSNPGVQAAG